MVSSSLDPKEEAMARTEIGLRLVETLTQRIALEPESSTGNKQVEKLQRGGSAREDLRGAGARKVR